MISREVYTKLRASKNYSSFGGPNQWFIQYLRTDGVWIDIQWMCRENAQLIVGPLPEFKSIRDKVVPVKKNYLKQ